MKKKPENSNFLYPTFQYCVIGDYEVLKNPYFRRLEIENVPIVWHLVTWYCTIQMSKSLFKLFL